MFHPTIKFSDYASQYISNPSHVRFIIVQIGAGGNGGYLTQRLSKLLYALSALDESYNHTYTIADGDQVEEKNLLRQPFIKEDLSLPKAQVLAERYDNAYGIPIFFRNAYVESVADIKEMFSFDYRFMTLEVPILLGCVDNNATRKLMHQAFKEMSTLLYLDCGIDAVDEESTNESGYSGQVVCGLKIEGKEILSPVGEVYPDILKDNDSRLPTEACDQIVASQPQRMQTNEMAALIMNSYLNTILMDHEIVSHYTNFNARTNVVRPVYLEKGVVPV